MIDDARRSKVDRMVLEDREWVPTGYHNEARWTEKKRKEHIDDVQVITIVLCFIMALFIIPFIYLLMGQCMLVLVPLVMLAVLFFIIIMVYRSSTAGFSMMAQEYNRFRGPRIAIMKGEVYLDGAKLEKQEVETIEIDHHDGEIRIHMRQGRMRPIELERYQGWYDMVPILTDALRSSGFVVQETIFDFTRLEDVRSLSRGRSARRHVDSQLEHKRLLARTTEVLKDEAIKEESRKRYEKKRRIEQSEMDADERRRRELGKAEAIGEETCPDCGYVFSSDLIECPSCGHGQGRT